MDVFKHLKHFRIKNSVPIAVSLGLFLGVASPALAEKIHSFTANGTLTSNGVLVVSEALEFDLSGTRRQWLHRIIPTTVTVHKRTHSYKVKIHKISNENNVPVSFSSHAQKGAVMIRMEAPRKGFDGHHKYRIQYEIRGACNFHLQHPQLYWAATGNEWPLPIAQAQAFVRLPKTVKVENVELKAWQGPPGSEEKANISMTNGQVHASASELKPGSGLDLEVDLNNGGVTEPGFLDELKWLYADWFLLPILPLMAVVSVIVYKWLRVHRFKRTETKAERWSPPDGLSPVEVGTLWDQRCDMSDIAGTLLDLAVRGYFTIREIPATGFFALSDRDYEFKKLSPPLQDNLRDHEELFMEALFGQSGTAYLSNVQGIFRQFIPRLEDQIYGRLISQGFMVRSPKRDKDKFIMIGLSLGALGIATLFLYGEEVMAKAAGMGFVLSGALVAAARAFIPLRTEKGKDTIESIHEFAETMRTASDHDVTEALAQDRELFHKLLPYAVVLGVFEKWSLACEDSMELWPDWFQFTRAGSSAGNFKASEFAREVWIATKVASMIFTASPPREYSTYAVGKFGSRKEQEHRD